MTEGLATYIRLKGCLALRGMTVTRFAASLDSSPQALMRIVVHWHGRVDTPKNQTTQKILAAVEVELAADLACTEAPR